MLDIAITVTGDAAEAPRYATDGDAGCDLVASEHVVLAAGGGRALVGTGVVMAIPPGFAGFVQPRSGLALRHGVTCHNTPGLIDSGYRGEIKVLLINTDPTTPFVVTPGDRIAQLVLLKVEEARFLEVAHEALPVSERGAAGFGSTGR